MRRPRREVHVRVTFDEFADELRRFLTSCWGETQPVADMPALTPDTDLFDAGVLDSLLVVELLAHIEDAFDIVIDVTRIVDPQAFFTLRGMYDGPEAVRA